MQAGGLRIDGPMTVTKRCSTCGQDKPENDWTPAIWKGSGGRCRLCRKEYAAGRPARQRDKDRMSAYYQTHRMGRYGISQEEYDRMLAEQGNHCAICPTPFTDQTPHIDHDHSCCPGNGSCGKCIRGLLCANCNKALGMFKDDAERLAAAIRYLEEDRD